MTLGDERVAEIVSRQGFGEPKDYGPKAPTTLKALDKLLQADRKRGFSMISEMYSPGMTAMAAPVRRGTEPAIGVITIAGPLMRLTQQRMLELGPELLATASELAMAGATSAMFSRPASPAPQNA